MLGWPRWIGVVCEDLERQRAFYRDVLGFREIEDGPGYVMFDVDGRLLELLARTDEPQYDRRRVSVGFEVENIRAMRDELVRRGAEPVTEVEGGPESTQYWTYFRDAEGNVFELVQPA